MKINIFAFISFFIFIGNITAIEKSSFGQKINESIAYSPNKGIVYNTIINDNNINVRVVPSLDGKIISKLYRGTKIKIVGVSREKTTLMIFVVIGLILALMVK